jgi:hypothetical protein
MRFRFRRRDLDARVRRARERAAQAGAEAALSQARYEDVQRTVVEPLRRAAQENQFAALLRRSLAEGHRGRA